MDLAEAILPKQVQLLCTVSLTWTLKLFLCVCFMTVHFHHKHDSSLQTVAPFRVVTIPQPFITDLFKRPFPPTVLPGCSKTGPSVPARLANNLQWSVQGDEPRSTYTTRCVCSNLLLDGDKQQDVICSPAPDVLGRKLQPVPCWWLNQYKRI